MRFLSIEGKAAAISQPYEFDKDLTRWQDRNISLSVMPATVNQSSHLRTGAHQ